MKSTIMTPVYNDARFLRYSIESALNQSYNGEYEIIVINDGSTDNTGEILEKYKRQFPGIIKVFHQENKGTGATRNKLLRESKGEVLLGLDADDFLHEEALEKTVKYFDSNPEVDMLYTNHIVINENGDQIVKREKLEVHKQFNEAILHCHFPGHLRAFRKSSIKRGFNPNLKGMSEDYDFLLNLVLERWPEVSVGHIPEFLYSYRVNLNGLNQNNPSKSGNILERKLKKFKVYGDKEVNIVPIHLEGLTFFGHKVEGEEKLRTGINNVLLDYLKEGLLKKSK